VSLTAGTGPFGRRPAGRFDFEPPAEVTYVERLPRRVRGLQDGTVVVDSDRVWLVHRTGSLPRYAFPAGDVSIESRPEPAVDGYVTVRWDAVERWLEEDSERIVHPRDPYHRIDVLDTSRHVVVRVNGEPAADSTDVRLLHEAAHPPRYYLQPRDVVAELVPEQGLRTGCAYKGWASYFDVAGAEGIAWTYTDPLPDAEPVRDRVCFFHERPEVELEVDGAVVERPETQWSGSEWIAKRRSTA
jgi:uncharacterized protein (DUF427 family)